MAITQVVRVQNPNPMTQLSKQRTNTVVVPAFSQSSRSPVSSESSSDRSLRPPCSPPFVAPYNLLDRIQGYEAHPEQQLLQF
jgi:hypothetical protein